MAQAIKFPKQFLPSIPTPVYDILILNLVFVFESFGFNFGTRR